LTKNLPALALSLSHEGEREQRLSSISTVVEVQLLMLFVFSLPTVVRGYGMQGNGRANMH
jgi:hypothetical protein